MSRMRGTRAALVAGFGLALGALAGCQAYYGGGTYPSPHYLEHPPTYSPESPPFPYARELATQQAQTAQAEAAGAAAAGGALPPRIR
jgi:hypothetical protein